MYQDNLLAKAKTIPEGFEIKGGVCKFHNHDKNEDWFMMIHPDNENKPMVSRVDPKSILPVWSCWEWMDSWLAHYEKSNPEFKLADFKTWLSSQPMTC